VGPTANSSRADTNAIALGSGIDKIGVCISL
jgi:hypothetical protein